MGRIAFGPVPSRRLGRSLGINHIPPKVCTYSCVYCQLGRTDRMRAQRRAFFETTDIVSEVRHQVEATHETGEAIDYLAFVPDGEPTLDINLGQTIRALRTFEIPIAVITNSSLLDLPEVRDDLCEADWVSVKMDTVRNPCWQEINRPHGGLRLQSILDGATRFAGAFQGDLQTETMVIDGLNDGEEELRATAGFVERLHPKVAYLSIPTRPPAEPWAHGPEETVLARAYEIVQERVARVELLTGYEGDLFSSTGDPKRDILSITSVHPMRESAVLRTLERDGAGWEVVSDLIEAGDLIEVSYNDHHYYLRPFSRWYDIRMAPGA